jgi:hypothetical protein
MASSGTAAYSLTFQFFPTAPASRLPQPTRLPFSGHKAFAEFMVIFGCPTTRKASLPTSLFLIGSLIPVPPGNLASSPGVTSRSSVPCRPQTPWYDGWMSNAFASIVQARPDPIFGRPVHQRVAPSITARYFSSCPPDSTSRWTPCPPVASSPPASEALPPLLDIAPLTRAPVGL